MVHSGDGYDHITQHILSDGHGNTIIKINQKEIFVPGCNHKITIIGNRVFMDCKEFRNGRWRFSLRALLYMLF